jgi:hypothetical protein
MSGFTCHLSGNKPTLLFAQVIAIYTGLFLILIAPWESTAGLNP